MHAKFCKNFLKNNGKHYINFCAVSGFPFGYSNIKSKICEIEKNIEYIDEIDMVINISNLKSGYNFKISSEINEMYKFISPKILKIIIETCYLSTLEKLTMCRLVHYSGAQFIKTSTGYGSQGAIKEDIILIKNYFNFIDFNVKIKASGGIKTLESVNEMIKVGADRIGTSNPVNIVKNYLSTFII